VPLKDCFCREEKKEEKRLKRSKEKYKKKDELQKRV